MICVSNPMTGEVRREDDEKAHRLVGYGWYYASLKDYKAWQVKRMEELRGTN